MSDHVDREYPSPAKAFLRGDRSGRINKALVPRPLYRRTAGAMAFCIAACVIFVTAAAGEQPVSRICSSSRGASSEGQIACINFIRGFQAAKLWHCRVFDWSDYLRTELSPDLWTSMGGLIPILENTADAFCDRGFSSN